VPRWTRDPAAVALGCAAAWAGVGSLDFHGTGSPAARWLHDAGLASVLLYVAAHDLAVLARRERVAAAAWAGAAAGAGLLLAAAPSAGAAVTVAAGAVAAGAEAAVARRRPSPWRRAGLVVLAAGGAAWLLGRSGGPLCRPDSLLQPHAVWHLAGAAALALWSKASLDAYDRS
jgi:hypothetical protein